MNSPISPLSPYLMVYILPLIVMIYTMLSDKRVYIVGIQESKIRIDTVVYRLSILTIGLMLAFRYGQGTDYYSYYEVFRNVQRDNFFSNTLYTEFGWKVLNYLIRSAGLSFEYVVFLVTIIELFCINKFIWEYCRYYRSTALVLLYPTVIFSYMFNLMRQGLVMCIFLGIMLPLLDKRKYGKYIMLSAITASLHVVSLVYVLLVPIVKSRNKRIGQIELLSYICAVLSIVFGITHFGQYVEQFIPARVLFHAKVEYSYMPVLENIVILGIMTCLFHIANNREELVQYYKIFLYGVILFFLTSWITMLANRMFSYWKYIYIVFLLKYFYSNKNLYKNIVGVFFIIFSSFMIIRNIDIAIDQGNYIPETNILNYPFISVFNKHLAEICRGFSVSLYP